jgi:hypothetical protein
MSSINRFYQGYPVPYESQYVPTEMPWDLIAKAGASQQARYDKQQQDEALQLQAIANLKGLNEVRNLDQQSFQLEELKQKEAAIKNHIQSKMTTFAEEIAKGDKGSSQYQREYKNMMQGLKPYIKELENMDKLRRDYEELDKQRDKFTEYGTNKETGYYFNNQIDELVKAARNGNIYNLNKEVTIPKAYDTQKEMQSAMGHMKAFVSDIEKQYGTGYLKKTRNKTLLDDRLGKGFDAWVAGNHDFQNYLDLMHKDFSRRYGAENADKAIDSYLKNLRNEAITLFRQKEYGEDLSMDSAYYKNKEEPKYIPEFGTVSSEGQTLGHTFRYANRDKVMQEINANKASFEKRLAAMQANPDLYTKEQKLQFTKEYGEFLIKKQNIEDNYNKVYSKIGKDLQLNSKEVALMTMLGGYDNVLALESLNKELNSGKIGGPNRQVVGKLATTVINNIRQNTGQGSITFNGKNVDLDDLEGALSGPYQETNTDKFYKKYGVLPKDVIKIASPISYKVQKFENEAQKIILQNAKNETSTNIAITNIEVTPQGRALLNALKTTQEGFKVTDVNTGAVIPFGKNIEKIALGIGQKFSFGEMLIQGIGKMDEAEAKEAAIRQLAEEQLLNPSNKTFNEYEKALIAKRTKELQANSKSFSIEPSQIVDPYVKNLLIEAVNEFTFSKNEKVNQRMKYKFTLAFDNDKELKNAEAVIDKKFSNKSSKDTNAEAVFKLNFATGERMYKAVTNKANTVEIIDLSTGQPVINKTGDKVFKNLGEFYEEQLDKY